jgi:hypothetical protein
MLTVQLSPSLQSESVVQAATAHNPFDPQTPVPLRHDVPSSVVNTHLAQKEKQYKRFVLG